MHTCTFSGQLNTLTQEFGFGDFILLTSLMVVHLILMSFYPACFLTYFPTMDNGFDYPNDLCVQNALWRRLDAIEILQIRLD